MPRNLVARQLLRLFRLVEDPAPQLGGDLDSNGFDISMDDGLIEFFNASGNRGGEIDALDGATREMVFIRAGDATTFSGGDPSIQLFGAGDSSGAGDIVISNGAGAVVLQWDQSAGRTLINVETRITALLEAQSTVRFTFGTEANGDIYYGSAGDGTVARLPIGAAGRVLRVNSGATAPEWSAGVQSWTPTLQAVTTNPTLGSGSATDGQYVVTDGWCHYWARWRFGTSGVAGGTGVYFFALPVTPHASLVASDTTYEGSTIGHGGARDNSATGSSTTCRIQLSAAGTGYMHSAVGVTFWSPTAPWTWAASDRISISGSYPVA